MNCGEVDLKHAMAIAVEQRNAIPGADAQVGKSASKACDSAGDFAICESLRVADDGKLIRVFRRGAGKNLGEQHAPMLLPLAKACKLGGLYFAIIENDCDLVHLDPSTCHNEKSFTDNVDNRLIRGKWLRDCR
jgi:hypothetical protein